MGKMHASVWAVPIAAVLMIVAGAFIACGGSDGNSSGGYTSGEPGTSGGTSGSSGQDGSTILEDGAVAPTPACKSESGTAAVQMPAFAFNIDTGETGWFAAPAVADLDADG